MNERIQKLIKETTEFQKIPYDGIDGVYREAFVFNKEKFAELIVRECAGFRNELGVALCTDPSALHRYFGVEK